MKTLGIVAISVIGGAVGACILMRICKKKKLPCGCHDKDTPAGSTTASTTPGSTSTPPLVPVNNLVVADGVNTALAATGSRANDWAFQSAMRTYNIVRYP